MNAPARLILVLGMCLALAATRSSVRAAVPDADTQSAGVFESMLAGPLADYDEIIFANRISGTDHWYVNFGYYCSNTGPGSERGFGPYPNSQLPRGYGDGGRLCRLNLRTGELKVLLEDPQGGVRDPQVHYDGNKILFSYRRGGTATYHLYEINLDGSGLVQLTDGPFNDAYGVYLPDGRIVFVSDRTGYLEEYHEERTETLWIIRADGTGIEQRQRVDAHQVGRRDGDDADVGSRRLKSRVGEDRVIPATTEDRVGTRTAFDPIIAVPTRPKVLRELHRIDIALGIGVGSVTEQPVVPTSAEHRVITGTTDDAVVTGLSQQDVIPGTTEDDVVPFAAEDSVVPGAAFDVIIAALTQDEVVAPTAFDRVIALSAEAVVIAGTQIDDVITFVHVAEANEVRPQLIRRGQDRRQTVGSVTESPIGACPGVERVVPGTADDEVVSKAAVQEIIIGAAEDQVVSESAEGDVVAFAGFDGVEIGRAHV